MKYMAIIDADEKPVSCEFIGCKGNVAPYLIGATTNIRPLEQESILDKVKAEMEEQKECRCFDDDDTSIYITGLNDAIDIIDKYKAKIEENI